MFEKCYQHLNKGGCLLIFPEGNSITEKRLRELKTGVARMAYGAEQQNDFKLGLNIVPMGLNYSDPHQFRSDLFVHIGKPIKVANYDHEPEDERELIRAITADVTDALQSAVLHIQDEKLDNVVAKVEHIFKPELKNIFGITSQLDKTFEMQKEVIDAIEHFDGIKEPAVTEIETEIDTYLSSLKKHGLTNRGLLESQTSITAFSLLKLILGLPFFVLGWLVNAIPYYLTRTIVLSLKVDEAFKGSLLMAVGTGAFVFYYIGMGIWASLHFNMWWLGIVGVLLAYALGLFCFIYSGWYGNFKEQLAFKNLIEEDRDEFAQLLLSRKEIVARLEQFRTSYTAE
ncbi:MAG: 1-acyl-sn-glycerol-3-phosphate acyltransferase, partial [Flavobacteriales bacterium]